MLVVASTYALMDAKLTTNSLPVAFNMPEDNRIFMFRCDRRAQDVRLDVFKLSENGAACSQYCLPNTAKYLAEAARLGATFGGNCGQASCVDPIGPTAGPETYVGDLQKFTFACPNATQQAADKRKEATQGAHLVSCSRFGALTTAELTRAAQLDGSDWPCAWTGSCYNIGVPRSRGCPLDYTWLGMMCYKPCPVGYKRSALCSCRADAGAEKLLAVDRARSGATGPSPEQPGGAVREAMGSARARGHAEATRG
jgi:hypothetical protein